ncbi:MAG: ribosome maturation factor RimM [Arsenophonus endosymbiont of Ceratovacuna japonica]
MIINKNIYFNIPINYVILGKLGTAYGIHGWIKVFSFTKYNEDIFKYQPWFIQHLKQWKKLKIEKWKNHNNNFIIKINNINDRNDANLITNCKIIINSLQLPKLKNNEYYWKDLIGYKVITVKGYNLGYVQNLMETVSNDVLIIKSNKKDTFNINKRLIPFIDKQVIKNINICTKIIKVDWDPSF